MGLTVIAKGLTDEKSYDCGYITFGIFRINLAKTYNQEFGLLYEKWYLHELTQGECDRANELGNEDLDIFLTHSDCGGKFTPSECKKIYNVIKDLSFEMEGHNYGVMKSYNMLEQWKDIFRHCYKRRVNLYFS